MAKLARFIPELVDIPLDPWGYAMGAWFDVADSLHARGVNIPEHWEYTAGIAADEKLPDLSDAELLHCGNVLERYTRLVMRAGRDY